MPCLDCGHRFAVDVEELADVPRTASGAMAWHMFVMQASYIELDWQNWTQERTQQMTTMLRSELKKIDKYTDLARLPGWV
jgi:hypothetical protein